MRLKQLRVFLAVVDAGNFGRAALELSTSQSTVSHSVRSLEEDLRVRLLERGRFGARPTEVGARVAEHARLLLQLENAIEQECLLADGQVKGELTVAVFESFEKRLLPDLLVRLRELHPQLTVTLVPVEETFAGYSEALARGTVQVAFGAWQVPPMCIGWEIMRDRHLVLLPPHATVEKESLDFDDLAGQPLVLAAGSECSVRLLAYLEENGQRVSQRLTGMTSESVIAMVARGLGVAILPELAALTADGSVRTVPFNGLERPILVLLPPHCLKLPTVRAFLNVVKGRFPHSELPLFSPDRNTLASTVATPEGGEVR